jgi:hypothetical protein
LALDSGYALRHVLEPASSDMRLAPRRDLGRGQRDRGRRKTVRRERGLVIELLDHAGYTEAVVGCAAHNTIPNDFGAVTIVSDNA